MKIILLAIAFAVIPTIAHGKGEKYYPNIINGKCIISALKNFTE